MGKTFAFDVNQPKEVKLSNNAKDYRRVSRGLNVHAFCLNSICKMTQKELIIPLKDIKQFDFNSSEDQVLCPYCQERVKPHNCGFYKCKYKIVGEKYSEEDEEYKEFKFEGDATTGYKNFVVEKKYISKSQDEEDNIFDPESPNTWLSLKVEVYDIKQG